MAKQKYPNGVAQWQKTYFEAAVMLEGHLQTNKNLQQTLEWYGKEEIYAICEELTDKFEEGLKGQEWNLSNLLNFLEGEL